MESIFITKEKAEILGFLCAEGSHYKYSCTYMGWSRDPNKKYKRTQIFEGINFNNNDKEILEYFRKLMLTVYEYSPRITGVPKSLRIHLKKKFVVKDLLKFTKIGYSKWKIPREVQNSNIESKSAFIRGLYEGDGTKLQKTLRNTYFIDFHMKNLKGLKQLQKLLKSIGIETRFYNDNTNYMKKLVVYGIPDILKFKSIIKPKFKNIDIAEVCRGSG